MPLDLQALINNGLLDELANRFSKSIDCNILLTSIGFPRGSIPNFDRMNTPTEFWYKVGEEIDRGVGSASFEALLASAARRLPANTIFAPFGRISVSEIDNSETYIRAIASDYHAFLSYSHRDQEAVRRVAMELRRRNVRVWLDEWSSPRGELFINHLEQVIANVEVVCVMYGRGGLSPWMRGEVAAALHRALKGDCLLLPVMLAGVAPEDLPLLLQPFSAMSIFKASFERDYILDEAALDNLAAIILSKASASALLLDSHVEDDK